MKTFRNIICLAAVIFAGFIITSCTSAEDRLPGTWITESVVAKVDSSKANLVSIDQNIASTKTTKFILNEDHTMALSIDAYTTDAIWSYNSDSGIISFRLDASQVGDAIELGKLEGDKIVYTSSVKHGTLTAVYVKE
ncbi:MAG: hypothetical protein K8R63_09495 [Bacteroidales bacterium]|nr:hypothetical protein [Bacteroidales bacterium]